MKRNSVSAITDEYYQSQKITWNRVVVHSDLNNFFASVEALFQPSLKDVPMAICGNEKDRHGIILAKNELAKKFGIKTGETVKSAKSKCRDLVTCPSRYPEYIRYSRAVREIYLRYTPCVEPFGIDEAWLDISSISSRTYTDGTLFENARKIAEEIKKTVLCETGLRVSVGVSFNKIFSKLASDMKKSDSTAVISPDNYKDIVWKLPVRDLLYVGTHTEKILKQNRLFTLADVARHKRSYMKSLFGKSGEKVWDFANGFDFSDVTNYTPQEESDSVSNSRTLPYDIKSIEEAENVLFALCDSVSERIRVRGLLCNTVRISIKDSELYTLTRQAKRLRPTDSVFEIFSDASRLFHENFDFSKSVRSLGVSLEGLQGAEFKQLEVFDADRERKKSVVDSAIDNLKLKYGDKVIYPAASLVKDELAFFDKKHPAFNHNL